MLRDQPMKPMDVAIYWTEYVMKFNGTRHLQNKGVKLYWFQDILLDVAAFFLLILILVIWILTRVLRFVINSFTMSSVGRWRKNKND
ncbi:hypothetical protein JTB14_021227 [Gonioctena quinquepunctata]|nr:hypothetical protein JTB14_021227 [Gonioctena quinquepunctata]